MTSQTAAALATSSHVFPTIGEAVHEGVTFRQNTAEGMYRYRLVDQQRDPRRSTYGLWLCVVEEGHPARMGGLHTFTVADIYKARVGRGIEWAGRSIDENDATKASA